MRATPALLSALALFLATAGLAEDQASRLLSRTREAMTRLNSLQAEVELTQASGASTGKLLLKRPRLVRLELTGVLNQTVVTTGETVTRYSPKTNQYTDLPAGPALTILPGVGDIGFFQVVGTTTLKDAPAPTVTHAGTQKLGELEVEVLEQVAKSPAGVTERIRYFVSPADYLVRRVERTLETPRGASSSALTLKTLRPDVEVAANAFEWTAPEGAKRLDLRALLRRPANPANPAAPRPDYTADLPAVGKTVPDFDLPRPGGERLSLFRAAKEKKVTLLNFWFVGCPPCRAEFPHFQKLLDELKDKSFQIIAVNRGDAEEKIRDFVTSNKYTFDVVMGGVGENYTVGKAYGVRAYPTNILIDAEGKVLWRGVGFRDPELKELRDAIKAAGVE